MFLTDERPLGISCQLAQARLANLFRAGTLLGASHAAYQRGAECFTPMGPPGGTPGLPELAQVSLLDPVQRGEITTAELRWEATGEDGALFPVLDATITVAPAGENAARLAMTACYRAPPGRPGTSPDDAAPQQVATTTVHALLTSITDALTSPAPAAHSRQQTGRRPDPQPSTQSGPAQ